MADDHFEQFPLWIPAIATLHTLSIYALGAIILSGLGSWAFILYLGFCLYVEFAILRKSCIHCYYHGKWCGLGRGKICALFFAKGDPERFIKREITWKALIPDMLVLLVPLAAGIVLLIPQFSLLRLGLILLLIAIAMGGNAMIRGSLVCKFCRQRTLGCPAEKFFSASARNP